MNWIDIGMICVGTIIIYLTGTAHGYKYGKEDGWFKGVEFGKDQQKRLDTYQQLEDRAVEYIKQQLDRNKL
jgi:hypothetical protein